jgi:hypothetical protein
MEDGKNKYEDVLKIYMKDRIYICNVVK